MLYKSSNWIRNNFLRRNNKTRNLCAGAGVVSTLLGACGWVETTLSISLIGLAEEMEEVGVGSIVGDNIGGEAEGDKWEVKGETVEGKQDEAWIVLE